MKKYSNAIVINWCTDLEKGKIEMEHSDADDFYRAFKRFKGIITSNIIYANLVTIDQDGKAFEQFKFERV